MNPSKTVMIPFTSRRKLEITQPVLCGGQIQGHYTDYGVWLIGMMAKGPIGDYRKKNLGKVQRLVCLGTTGAMRVTPTAAMEVVLNLPPLDILVIRWARMAAYRPQCNGNWQHHHASKHPISLIFSNWTF
ncbi:hypothetical protein J6590_020209 [Homalodisca vitripennis]|nr:hypothetical protein J6590_020209 [Homalodisca vitripennis]